MPGEGNGSASQGRRANLRDTTRSYDLGSAANSRPGRPEIEQSWSILNLYQAGLTNEK